MPFGRSACGIVIAMTIAASALAQETQRVIITGSNVPRAIVEAAADAVVPVTVLSPRDAERAGHATLGAWLRSLPHANGGSPNPNNADGGSNPGYAGVALRGAGAGATLVLVNGRRMAPFAFSGVAVDLNSLPLAAIERVELMRDGGSALYGAEAVAGVLNVVLRRGYDGVETRLGGQVATDGGGASSQFTLATGLRAVAESDFDLLLVIDHREQQALPARLRSFGRSALRPDQGQDETSAISRPGAYAFDLSTPYADFSSAGLDCNAQQFPGAVPVGDQCRHDYMVFADLVPRHRATSVFVRAQRALDVRTAVRVEALVATNRYGYRASATPIWGGFTLGGEPFVLPSSSPYNPFGQDVQFWSRSVELGPRSTVSLSTGWRLAVGLDMPLGGWLWDITAGTSGSQARLELGDGHLSESAFRRLLAEGGRFNPFGRTEDARANLQSATLHETGRRALALSRWIDARGSVELGRWQGRPVELAAGAEWRRESVRDEPLASLASGDLLGQAGASSPLSGRRSVVAAYSELSWPVFSGAMLQASARWDRYGDFGQALSPKLALAWTPSSRWTLRASASGSFRAPSLSDLNTAQTHGLTGALDDPLRCPGGVPLPGADAQLDCQASFAQLGGGNPGLQSERATTQSLGAAWRPMQGLRVEIGGWRINKTRDIGIVRDTTVLDPEHHSALAHLVQRLPASDADRANGLPGRIAKVDVRLQNLGSSRYAGWDFEVDAGPVGLAGGRLQATWTTARMTQAEQWLVAGAEQVVLLDGSVNGTPVQRWRHAASVQWQRQAWTLAARLKSIGSYRDENLDAQGQARRVSRWWTLGVDVAVREGAHEWSLGIANAFNRAPPFSNKTSSFAVGWDDLVHDPLGRVIQVAWRLSLP